MRSGSKILCVSRWSRRWRRWMPPEMPAPVTKSRYFCRAPQRSVRGLRDRSGEPLKSGRLALLEASRIPLWFPLHRLPSIVDATPPPPPHHHRSLPTGCPRRPERHPSRRRTPQHRRCTSPHPVAATPRQLPPTPAVETHSANRARRTQRQQRRAHAQPPPLENRHYAGSRLQNGREIGQGRLLPGLQS